MPEPTTTTAASLTAALILLLGPTFGPLLAPLIGEFLLVLAGAVVGVMHPASSRSFAGGMAAAFYVVKWVASAIVLTGFATMLLERYLHLPAHNWPSVVAWGITFFADRWRPWLDGIADGVASRLARKGAQK